MNMKKLIILSLFLSLSMGQECDGLTAVELWGEWYDIESTTEIGNLTNLTSLSLSQNQLKGEIPSEMGTLAKLEYLNLGNNEFTGEIPSEIGNLTNLTVLGLMNKTARIILINKKFLNLNINLLIIIIMAKKRPCLFALTRSFLKIYLISFYSN